MGTSEARWHPAAVEDGREARDWYAERSPLAARAFLLELAEAVEAVREAPKRWPRGAGDTRRYVFTGPFPFTLVYRVQRDGVLVLAVAHHKRRPGYWLDRG